MSKYKLIIASLLFGLTLFSQSNRTKDSMLAIIEACKVDTQKVYKYTDLIKQLQTTSPNEVEEVGKINLELARKIGFKRGEAMALCGLGEFHNARGTYGMALQNFIPAAKIYEQLKDFKKASSTYNSIGNTYLGLNNYEKAR